MTSSMRHIFLGSLLALLPCVSAPLQAAQTPIVRLELVPARALPGIPVNMLVSFTNSAEQQIEIPNGARLHVTPPSGEPFVAIADESSSPMDSFVLIHDPEATIVLEPGQTKTVVVQVNTFLAEPMFFWDERISWPGTYLFRLESWVGSAPPYQTVYSNDATLVVREPQGQDLAVWKRMLEVSEGRGWSGMYWSDHGIALAQYISENAPDSGYFPYVAHLKWGQSDAQLHEGIERAIASRPDEAVSDLLKGALVGWYMERGEEALASGDLARALELFAQARARATDLKRTTPYSWIRGNVERWLTEELDEEPVLRGRFVSNVGAMASYTKPVEPFVQCVDLGSRPNDPYIVWFGYENPNRGRKFVERGKGNDLTPSFTMDLPPRVFQTGRQKHGFSVTTHADRVTWTIDGQSATASRETLPRCTYPDLKTLALRPVIDCIETHDDNVVVSFGYENPGGVAVRIAAGPDNQVTGSNEPPTTIFEPGRHYNAFRVKVNRGQAVSWTVAGRTVTSASRSSSAPCFDGRN